MIEITTTLRLKLRWKTSRLHNLIKAISKALLVISTIMGILQVITT